MSILQPWMAVGVVWVSPTLRPHSPFLGQRRVSPRGHLSPANTSPSPQCGEGTPQVTGFFEVLVAGKLVHSKKVCLSVHSAPFGASGVLGLGLASWSRLSLASSSLLQGGDGYVDTESKFLKLVAAIKAALAQA